jgi:hypothetical protein
MLAWVGNLRFSSADLMRGKPVMALVSQQFQITLKDLKAILEPLEDEFPHLTRQPDRLFVMWFMRAYATADTSKAADALPGPNREKGIDALFVDTTYHRVILVQGKYRTTENPKPEGWPDIIELIEAAEALAGPRDKLDEFCDGIDERVQDLLKGAHARLRTGEYDLEVVYATSGSISPNHKSRAKSRTARIEIGSDRYARFVPYTRAEVLGLVDDELDGSTPPLPPIVLPIASKSVMEHVEPVVGRKSGLTMWVFTVKGFELANRVKPYRLLIFNSNVRGFLGLAETGISRDILTTIEESPHQFSLVNNGITMLATTAKPDRVKGQPVVVIDGAQIVNGQQTTRVLEAAGKEARDVSVLVRVIEVPAGVLPQSSGGDSLTDRIVRATNRQNRITAADLKSNHPKQVWLGHELEKLGYRYLRKREARTETAAGPRAREELKKSNLARAVASCLNEGWGLGGEERRFDLLYDKIFWSKDPWYYALCYVFFSRVTELASGSGERTWARFAVVRFLWQKLEKDLRKSRKVVVPALRRADESAIVESLDSAIESVMDGAIEYFAVARQTATGEQEDAQKLFKRADAYEGFERWWRSQKNTRRNALNQSIKDLRKALRDSDA